MSDNEVSEYPDCRKHDHDKPCPFCLNEQDELDRKKKIAELQSEVDELKHDRLEFGKRNLDLNAERDALAQEVKRLKGAMVEACRIANTDLILDGKSVLMQAVLDKALETVVTDFKHSDVCWCNAKDAGGVRVIEKTIIQEVQDLFISKIMEKNSWGKNEIIDLWKDCLLKMLMERLSCSSSDE